MASNVLFALTLSLRRRSLRAPFLLCWLLAYAGELTGAEGELQRFDISRPAMGTLFRLTFYAADAEKAATAAEAAFRRVEKLERICSDYRADSELTILNQSTEHVASPELFQVIHRGLELARLTQGAFDISAGHYSQLWRRSKRRGELPTAQQLERVRPLVGWQLVTADPATRLIRLAKPGMQIDLGGIAKGYAADAALKVLNDHGITSATVAASGDLAIGDPPPGEPAGWQVRLRTFESDENGDQTVVLNVSRCGVSTSGDLHQFVEIGGVRYSHIVDPGTGLGLTKRVAASVIAPDATYSDALATAACVMGVERAIEGISGLEGCTVRLVSFEKGERIERVGERWPGAEARQ